MSDVGGVDPGSVNQGGDAGIEGSSNAEPLTDTHLETWRDSLSNEQLRNAPALQSIADVDSLSQQFIDLQGMMGTAIRIPSENAGEADIVEFHRKLKDKVPGLMEKPDPSDQELMGRTYDALGRPEDATKYTRPQLENAPEVDDARDKSFSEKAHEIGISDAQFQALYKWDMEANAAAAEVHNKTVTEGMDSLHQEWGHTFDPRMNAISQLMTQFEFPEAAIEAVNSRKIGNGFAKALYNVVKQFGGENEVATQGQNNTPAAMTPEEADRQIQEIMSRDEYRHHDYQVRKPWMDKVQALMRYAVPGAAHGDAAVDQLRRGSGQLG